MDGRAYGSKGQIEGLAGGDLRRQLVLPAEALVRTIIKPSLCETYTGRTGGIAGIRAGVSCVRCNDPANTANRLGTLCCLSVRSAQMLDLYREFCTKYPVISIEDPFEQDDWEPAVQLTAENVCQVTGAALAVGCLLPLTVVTQGGTRMFHKATMCHTSTLWNCLLQLVITIGKAIKSHNIFMCRSSCGFRSRLTSSSCAD